MPLTFTSDRKTTVNLIITIVLCSLMMCLTYFSMGMYEVKSVNIFRLDKQSIKNISVLIAWIFANGLFFMALLTGRTDRFRAVFFISIAFIFPIGFIAEMYELRGFFMAAPMEIILKSEVPYCHIVIPQTIITMITDKTVIFPGTLLPTPGFNHTIAAMIVIWFAASIGTGRGFCGWICWFGGWEDGFSRILRKPVIKNISPVFRYVPYAVLVSVVLVSFAFSVPAYCWWVCPFKSVSEFPQVLSAVNLIQMIIFISLFVVLVIVLPLMTGKRTQCAYFCPFGAMQNIVDKVNVFDVRVDTTKCGNCKKCIRECPMNSISEKSLANGKTGQSCVKCGKCVDSCPQKAISYHIKGTTVGGVSGIIARISLLFLCFMILATMGGSFISSGLYRILLWITTGSILN